MIQLLATRYNKRIAYVLGLIFCLNILIPAYGRVNIPGMPLRGYVDVNRHSKTVEYSPIYGWEEPAKKYPVMAVSKETEDKQAINDKAIRAPGEVFIDGPSQPEMSSFKPAGTNDMVNLFTGDFSYNIALLDVGGYPVNIFYDGGIGMEQEASWVGLGWNINPGNVNRNMRGVPDDFNGQEKLIQSQNMKKNVTWGVSFGGDLELVGIKNIFSGSVGASLGFSVNNYLGPAIELGIKGTTGFRVGSKGISEKGPVGVSAGLNANLSSRSGLTLTPSVSLSANLFKKAQYISTGVGVSTSYNSRTGIKALQIAGQMSMNYKIVKDRIEAPGHTNEEVNKSSIGANIFSSSISFTKPSYVPAMRSVITNSSGAGRFQLGLAWLGVYGSLEVEGYGQVSEIASADRKTEKPMVGYLYAEKAKNNRDAVMDFTRFNDQEVTPSTTIISVPQYAYDVFSIQGEGTGGSIRAYRNDNGYVRDNFTGSKDKSWSAGVDVGIPGHIGANFNTVKTPSSIGEWRTGNKLSNTIGFSTASGDRENVYFRNPGENSVLHPNQYDSIGGTDMVRYKLGGTGSFPTIEPKLQRLTSSGAVIGETDIQRSVGFPEREKRTQVTSFLKAEEASIIGLDKKIKNYDPQNFIETGPNGNRLKVLEEIDRVSGDRKANHISQINVTEADGKRYVYGIPVYNLVQKDFSFTVADNCKDCDLVPFTNDDASLSSSHINSGVGGKDGYTQITETPPYAHSFLLSGLLSPDYVDVNGDGITEDDLGGAVKFNYTKTGVHEWRTPLANSMQANSNPGNLTEKRDDKGIISYGKRESWYLHSIESKTMIAFFTLENRLDGKGAGGELNLVNYNDNSLKQLKQIDLYNKADLKKNGLAGAKPIKTVHFGYNNSLCNGTPDNQSGGKLTLAKIWFTYNGQRQTSTTKNQYVFSYTKSLMAIAGENPDYAPSSSDRWGNYKPTADNPGNPVKMKNRDYPYSIQNKATADKYANAWNLKKILLPSGGQLEVEYESDDYAFVQNKRAAVMSEIIGFGSANNSHSNNLYTVNGSSITENDYLFIKVPEACASKTEVYQKYLQGVTQLAVKMKVTMSSKGYEFLTSYATFSDYGVYTGAGAGIPAIWIKMNKVDGYSPLSQTAIEFLRQQLPGQAFTGYDVSDNSGIEQILSMLKGWVDGIKSSFSDIPRYLRQKGLAQIVQVNESFVRLNDPDGFKYGGGYRVKKVVLKDNWNRMTTQYGATYGQEYDYTTKEVFNGTERTISSGVASYEPSIGGEENPFQSIVQIANDVPLGPTSYGAIEMPVMDAFFPAPLVGYSKVTVASIGKKQNPDPANKKTRSGVGRQVTEFYTAKDFPVYYNHTPLDPASDKQEHSNPTLTFFWKYAFDSRAISQGFLVATNDMHGKVKSQSSYAENDPATRLNYTENFYRNTGVKGLDEKFDFAYNTLSGEVKQGNMGIDIELMTDTREFSLSSSSFEIQAQVDWMLPPPFPLWLPFIWPVQSESENIYRAVTTTKVINYHSVLDSVLVIDKGSRVSTKNLVYDAETGQVVVNRTNNEFDKPVYLVNYPAYWAYSGMGLTYKNIDAIYSGISFLNGKIVSGITPTEITRVFESGDELFILDPGSPAGCAPSVASSDNKQLIWALDENKPSSSLTNINPDFIFIDKAGKPYTRTGVKFRIVRSGKRNMLGTPVASIALMTNPVDVATHKLAYNTNSEVVNASAVEYKERWQTDNDVFKTVSLVYDPNTCTYNEVEDCNGYVEKKINPYRKGLIGNFRSYRSMIFYGERKETNPTAPTNLPRNGFLDAFNPYWSFNNDNNLVPALSNPKWVWNSQVTRINAKSMELETKDALNIYTAAQYGYNKTMPTAITQNSRYDQMAYEGFEDKDYLETLNQSTANPCVKKHIDFAGMANSQIVNADLAGFNAHTGKYVLGVNANTTAGKTFSISDLNNETFSTQLLDSSVEVYNYLAGAKLKYCESYSGLPPTCTESIVQSLTSTFTFPTSATRSTEYTFFYNAPVSGNYTFRFYFGAGGCGASSSTIEISYTNLVVNGITYTQAPVNVFLCQGLNSMKLTWTAAAAPSSSCSYAYSFSTSITPFYYSQLAQNCPITNPVATNESMMNPTFHVPTEKKMVFSAWVRDNCTANGTCTNASQVDVLFNGGSQNVTIKPTGPVIEGWQRYEGYFTAPAGTTQMTLNMVNSTSGTIYFDDIRIHPFNANMKSYVYDPVNLRLTAQLDANNYASFYEYDAEGILIRTKAETKEGVKTVTENRSAKQKDINNFQ